jgi:hypothetical protein
VTIGATSLLVVETDEIEPGIRELRCTSAIRPRKRGEDLLSVYAHVLPEVSQAAPVYRSLEEARATLKVVPLHSARRSR